MTDLPTCQWELSYKIAHQFNVKDVVYTQININFWKFMFKILSINSLVSNVKDVVYTQISTLILNSFKPKVN